MYSVFLEKCTIPSLLGSWRQGEPQQIVNLWLHNLTFSDLPRYDTQSRFAMEHQKTNQDEPYSGQDFGNEHQTQVHISCSSYPNQSFIFIYSYHPYCTWVTPGCVSMKRWKMLCSCVSVFAALMIQICVENRRKRIKASKLHQEASQLDHSSGDGELNKAEWCLRRLIKNPLNIEHFRWGRNFFFLLFKLGLQSKLFHIIQKCPLNI